MLPWQSISSIWESRYTFLAKKISYDDALQFLRSTIYNGRKYELILRAQFENEEPILTDPDRVDLTRNFAWKTPLMQDAE